MKEHSQIQFGNRKIVFNIVRTQRKKSVSILICPLNGIEVRSPAGVTIDELRTLVKTKSARIVQLLHRQSELNISLPRKEYVSGESVQYMGRNYRLKVKRVQKKSPSNCNAVGSHLEVEIHKDKCSEREQVRTALIAWFKAAAKRRFQDRVKLLAKKTGYKVKDVIIANQLKRWASCDKKGVLRFNWRLAMAPTALIDYVIVHELCHIKVKNHSLRFWKEVKAILPDYERRKERLRVEGASYDI